MKKILVILIAAMFIISGVVFAKTIAKEKYGELFEANVEQLADGELCPGEEENCMEDGERCLYHYGNKNYNIETKRNRYPGQQD